MLAAQLETIHLMSGGRTMQAAWRSPPPLWIGANAPPAIARAARIADGWIGSGSSSLDAFRENVETLRSELEAAGRDPAAFRIAKRVFLHHDEDPTRAREVLGRWFEQVYGAPWLAEEGGVAGSEETCLEHLGAVLDAGADFVLVHAPVTPTEHLQWVVDRVVPALR